jgi:NAD(P)-dependent dehydrogenase (short-subunit alcohol dehydrogenase family)
MPTPSGFRHGGQATNAGASLYNATKWGIEGFMEALAKEIAPFAIGVTIVELGGARTGFRSAAGRGLATPLARIMIDSVEQDPAPRRLALGGDACTGTPR